MPQLLNFFFSNRFDVLYRALKNRLFEGPSHPFRRRIIIVQGPAMKRWLTLQLAQDPTLNIAAGIEFIYLGQAFEKLLDIAHPAFARSLPSTLELSLAIETEISCLLQGFENTVAAEREDWQPLFNYLNGETGWRSLKGERRLIAISQELAALFHEYDLSGTIDPQEIGGWQGRLWNKVFSQERGWSTLSTEFLRHHTFPTNSEIHFFSISFMRQNEITFLESLATHVPIHTYLLSPCAVFWSDIRSDRESSRLITRWERKNASTAQLDKLEELLADRHPLLANFGRMGREMTRQIEESNGVIEAGYLLPQTAEKLAEQAAAEDLAFIPIEHPLTLLEALQTDMLLMLPDCGQLHSFDADDDSIQLHSAPTKKREVQILYNTLLKTIEKRFPQVCPSDIVVMAPEIGDYAAFIKEVFGSAESQLSFEIQDLEIALENEAVRGFELLIKISKGRWEASQLMQLFRHKGFCRRHRLSHEDVKTIENWIERVSIRWGANVEHRHELLQRHHREEGLVEDSHIGTWEHGFERLLAGLTMTTYADPAPPHDAIPFAGIDFSQGELLGKWMQLFYDLRKDLAPLTDGTRLTISEWADYLCCLLDSYITPDSSNTSSLEDYSLLKSILAGISSLSASLEEPLFSFQSVNARLEVLLKKKTASYRFGDMQAVQFCSMVPLRTPPAKVIALLGMGEDQFPRHSIESSLKRSQKVKSTNYQLNKLDSDRHLFLEALQTAQEQLIICYQGYSHADGHELRPSSVVEELFAHLNHHYTLAGKTPLESLLHRHPFSSFDASYFYKDSPLHSYSIQDYRAALAHAYKDKADSHVFLNTFSPPQPTQELPYQTVDLKQLTALVRHPIKFTLNQALGIYLDKTDKRNLDDDEIQQNTLERYSLKKETLKTPFEVVMKRAEKEGKVPLFGPFKKAATKRLKEDAEEWQTQLNKYQISPENIFQIELSSGVLKATQTNENHWLIPAPIINVDNGQAIRITGKLPYVTTKGLLALSKGSFGDLWKSWPAFLLYHYAAQQHVEPLEKQLVPLQTGQAKKAFFDDPTPYLKGIIHYHNVCLKNFSPLLPDWIPLIIDHDVAGLEKKMKQVFADSYGGINDHELRWILNEKLLPCAEELMHNWKGHAEELAGDVIEHWT